MKTALAAFAALFRGIIALPAVALTVAAGPASAETTKMMWGCEWKQAANGNYWSKVDGGCKHWVALGYDRQRDTLGTDAPEEPAQEPEPSEPEETAGA